MDRNFYFLSIYTHICTCTLIYNNVGLNVNVCKSNSSPEEQKSRFINQKENGREEVVAASPNICNAMFSCLQAPLLLAKLQQLYIFLNYFY